MRRVLTDTNVVISALLFPDSVPAQALVMVLAEDQLVLTSWIIDELHEVVERKRPDLVSALNDLLASIDYDPGRAVRAGWSHHRRSRRPADPGRGYCRWRGCDRDR